MIVIKLLLAAAIVWWFIEVLHYIFIEGKA